jgi:hypothetical protein
MTMALGAMWEVLVHSSKEEMIMVRGMVKSYVMSSQLCEAAVVCMIFVRHA